MGRCRAAKILSRQSRPRLAPMTVDGRATDGRRTGDGRAGGVVVRGRRRHGGAAYSGGGEGLRALTMCRRSTLDVFIAEE